MATPSLYAQVAHTLSLTPLQVQRAWELFDQGCTVPFIARYRKEHTQSLDEVELRAIAKELERVSALEAKRAQILSGLATQGINDPSLLKEVRDASSPTQLDDLWAPYRPRRQTLGQRAIEAGLAPVADALMKGEKKIFDALSSYTSTAYQGTDDVLSGARNILAERIADDAQVRAFLREKAHEHGRIASKKKRGADPNPTYELYLDFAAQAARLKPHQTLAMRRGEQDGALSLKLVREERWTRHVQQMWAKDVRDETCKEQVELAATEAITRLLLPQAEREVRETIEAMADEHAIEVFALNLKNLLLSPPLPGHTILGLDPGLRTGTKVAIIDPTGALLHTGTLSTLEGQHERAAQTLAGWITAFGVDLLAIGNGTGSHQAQQVASLAIESNPGSTVRWAVVDEAGASVYSASELAREEHPELDVSIRGAVSIARRLQDPLAELIKIDPQSLGVGMYQHDVNQKRLASRLLEVVEDVVHAVGVDLNTASSPLLAAVSGIGPSLASSIVDHRTHQGPFASRAELLEVRGLGAKTFEQCAGFLRIREGSEPLDATSIHPERYALAHAISAKLPDRDPARVHQMLRRKDARDELEALAIAQGAGRPTLLDILTGLTQPARDPRQDFAPPVLREQMLRMEDLLPGMRLQGTVRNVVDFGAFVDLGVKQDGLIHISKMRPEQGRAKSPYDHVSVGQSLEVEVVEVDLKRGRIALAL